MKTRTQRGFTLVEIIVVIAVIAILAAILTPYITRYIDDSRIAKAKNETQVIGAAMASFYKDVGRWPINNNYNTNSTYGGVYAGTSAPTAAQINTGTSGFQAAGGQWNSLDTHLGNLNPPNTNAHNYPLNGDYKSNGPYAAPFPNDPWNHPYLINAADFATANAVWVISAGPNGVINSSKTAQTLSGDDIGFRLK